MKNPQENTYKYYDIVYKEWMSPQKTIAEIDLLKKYVSKKDHILDLGCGSGRHLIPFHQEGYDIVGLDVATHALELLKEKDSSAKVIHGDFYESDLESDKFTLVYMMWNAFAEFALTKDQAKKLLQKIYSLLKKDGYLIFDLSVDIEPKDHWSFSQIVSKGKYDYRLDWKSVECDPTTHTTKCNKVITVSDQEENIIDKAETIITQRWWSKEEIVSLAKSLGFSIQFETIEDSDYLFCILRKN